MVLVVGFGHPLLLEMLEFIYLFIYFSLIAFQVTLGWKVKTMMKITQNDVMYNHCIKRFICVSRDTTITSQTYQDNRTNKDKNSNPFTFGR